MAGSSGRVESAVGGKAEGGGFAGDRKASIEGATVEGVGAERDDGVEIAKHWEAENGVYGDIWTESEGQGDRGAGRVGIGCAVADNSSQVTVVSSVEVRRVANGATELNGFKRVRIIERKEFDDEVRAFGHEPEMERQVAGV